jgi:hypothetical protein
MFCGKCGTKSVAGNDYCGKCGTRLVPTDTVAEGEASSLEPQSDSKPKSKTWLLFVFFAVIGLIIWLILSQNPSGTNMYPTSGGDTSSSTDESGVTDSVANPSSLLDNVTVEELDCGGYSNAAWMTVVNDNDQVVTGQVDIAWKHQDGTVAGTSGNAMDFLANSRTRLKVAHPQDMSSFATCEVYNINLY